MIYTNIICIIQKITNIILYLRNIMKSQISNQMGDDLNVQQLAENEPLGIIQAIFYTCLGGFSVQEILENLKK